MSNATETPIDTIDSGHTAWILMSCALVRRPGVFETPPLTLV